MKYEIKVHDGPGRLNKIIFDNKTLESPLLAYPINIPPFHSIRDEKIQKFEDSIPKKKNKIIIGYLPPLHTFSKYDSKKEVLDVLKTKIFPKISESIDIICFPLDRASPYRSSSEYPEFIDYVRKEMKNLNFSWVYTNSEDKTNWNVIKDLPFVILGDLSTLIKRQRLLYNYIKEVSQNIPNALKYCPGIPPSFIPLLSYLGIDVFDTIYGKLMAYNNVFLDWNDQYIVRDFTNFDPPCMCNACSAFSERESDLHWLLAHNENITESIIKKVRISIKEGKLRDLVKQYILSDPVATALLRIADLDKEDNLLDKFTPTIRKQTLFLTSSSDFIRPEVRLFQKRLKTRFIIPEWVEGILLLPCSAKKPYSESRSHKIIAKGIKRVLKGKRHNILELIVTSPLGIVPRYLENIYPAGFYDISVTGNWTQLEQNFVEDLLISILKKTDRSLPILSYLEDPEKVILNKIAELNPEFNIEVLDINNSETSSESLTILKESLKNMKDKLINSISKNTYQLEFFKSMANYQFGLGAGDVLFPTETIVKFKSMLLTALLDNKQVATLHHGHISLTAYGATRLSQKLENYKVYFADEKINGSAVYTPGIVKADHKIRPNDIVLVYSEKEKNLLGIGQSYLSGQELEDMSYGIGVSIKKKIKKNIQ